jgi:uncharacterized protein (DUF1800 family)
MARLNAINPQQRRPQAGINENYARELMELHTLGVDSGYTQEDVIAVAKILTGWTIDRPQQGGEFAYRAQWHVEGSKTVMGKSFASAGEKEGERLLDFRIRRRRIIWPASRSDSQDDPPAALVIARRSNISTPRATCAKRRAIITSPEFSIEELRPR